MTPRDDPNLLIARWWAQWLPKGPGGMLHWPTLVTVDRLARATFSHARVNFKAKRQMTLLILERLGIRLGPARIRAGVCVEVSRVRDALLAIPAKRRTKARQRLLVVVERMHRRYPSNKVLVTHSPNAVNSPKKPKESPNG